MIDAIILAGGKGKRMEANISKQYIEIKGKPIIYYTIKRFMECGEIDRIILVIPKDEIDYCRKEIIEKYKLKIDFIVEGGKERQDSVYNGLRVLNDSEIVLIHDGARPFVSNKIITDGIELVKEFGAVAPGVMPKDTIKVKNEENLSLETPKREMLVAIQTPQIFKTDLIKSCHENVKNDKKVVTDDTMVVELYGNKVYLYKGEYTNIKVTTPEDLVLAEYLAK